MDFVGEFWDAESSERVDLLRATLATAAEALGYLDVDDGSEAVAAAAIVAAVRTGRIEFLGQTSLDECLREEPLDLPGDLPALARQALDRVQSEDSELFELWEGSEEIVDELNALRGALA